MQSPLVQYNCECPGLQMQSDASLRQLDRGTPDSSNMLDHLCRLKDLSEKAPEELKAYCECMDYYR